MAIDANRNISEWLNQSLSQLEAGKQLTDFPASNIPCYHFRMSVELVLKTFNIATYSLPIGHYDQNPTHSILHLWGECLKKISKTPEAQMLRQSIDVFTLHHTDYIYVKYRKNNLHVPSSRFTSQDVALHKDAAQKICQIVESHLSNYK